jgi:hypothetical protein
VENSSVLCAPVFTANQDGKGSTHGISSSLEVNTFARNVSLPVTT